MPFFDRTGPNGMGPRTGGRRGDCGTKLRQNASYLGWFRQGQGLGRCLWGLGLVLGPGYLGYRGWKKRLFPSGLPEKNSYDRADSLLFEKDPGREKNTERRVF
jgi:hypothetical protein